MKAKRLIAGLSTLSWVSAAWAGIPIDADFSNCSLVGDTTPIPPPNVSRPAYLETYIDPNYGSEITRITGDPGTPIPGLSIDWPTIARHNYSVDAAWSADQALLVLDKKFKGLVFLDGTTYEPLFHRPSKPGQSRWHPLLPDIMIYVDDTCEVGHWNVRTDVATPIIDISDTYTDCKFGSKGNPSADGTRLTIMASRNSDGKVVVLPADLERMVTLSEIDASPFGFAELEYATISPSGEYVFVHHLNSDVHMVFDTSGNPTGPLWDAGGQPSHFDFTRNADGEDVAIGRTKKEPFKWDLITRRMFDGEMLLQHSLGPSHTSARNHGRPLWVYGTANDNTTILAYKIDGTQQAQMFALFPNAESEYLAEAHGVPSPDGTRVLFASQWDDPLGPISAFVVDIRNLCTDLLSRTLSVSKGGNGDGTVTTTPGGIDCGIDCDGSFPHGTEVALSTVEAPGCVFGGWSGDTDCVDASVSMEGDLACVAGFEVLAPAVVADQVLGGAMAPGRPDCNEDGRVDVLDVVCVIELAGI